MQTSVSAMKTTTLMLNEREAEWLKALMQNPIGVMYPQDEPPDDREMRAKFWTALGGNAPATRNNAIVCQVCYQKEASFQTADGTYVCGDCYVA